MNISRTLLDVQEKAPDLGSSLDIYSIRHTNEVLPSEVAYAIPEKICIYNAPFFAWKSTEYGWNLAQGNCHHWDCPKCGIGRAKLEFKRIVEGCRVLAKHHTLYFITLTCKGKEISVSDADRNYYNWTSKLLNACRMKARRSNLDWTYVQVTERQKRGHPHSHIISTWKPHDLIPGIRADWKTINGQRIGETVDCLRSEWFAKRLDSAGLGSQYDIGEIANLEGASRYAAKYLFKAENFLTEWPKKWRRVRYSNSFPKLPERETEAVVILTGDDWLGLAKSALVINAKDQASVEAADKYLWGHDVLIRKPVTASLRE